MNFYFINPKDLMPMIYETQEAAEKVARTYLGGGDWWGDDTDSIVIYKSQVVSVVKRNKQS